MNLIDSETLRGLDIGRRPLELRLREVLSFQRKIRHVAPLPDCADCGEVGAAHCDSAPVAWNAQHSWDVGRGVGERVDRVGCLELFEPLSLSLLAGFPLSAPHQLDYFSGNNDGNVDAKEKENEADEDEAQRLSQNKRGAESKGKAEAVEQNEKHGGEERQEVVDRLDEGRELEEVEEEDGRAGHHEKGLGEPAEGEGEDEVDEEEAVQQEERVEDGPRVALASHEGPVDFSVLGLVALVLEGVRRGANEVENDGGKK